MKINNKIKVGIIFLIGIFLISSFVSAYISSSTQYTAPGAGSFGYLSSQGVGISPGLYWDDANCNAGQDFIIQIAPFGCEPAVVRSDLLEEQNVPVFCQLAATKINPLIKVEAIDYISFRGQYPKEISGVGFHPARAAIKGNYKTLLNSPILENIGYAVIVLKKQKNESAMPDFVEGTLTANIRYDIENAFGIGRAVYYLPELKDSDWSEKFEQYGFWQGRGYLKADGVDNDGATISIYSDENRKITSVNLNKGQTSQMIYLPGFYCMAGLQLKLDGLKAPDTRAKLNINGEIVEVAEKEKFLDNRCSVRDIDKRGLVEKVKINCKEDERRGNFDLEISPKIQLEFDGAKKEGYEIGEKLPFSDDESKAVYLGYIGTKGNSIDKEDLYVRFVQTPYHGDKLTEGMLSEVSRYNNGDWISQEGRGLEKVVKTIGKGTTTFLERFTRYLVQGTEISVELNYGEKESFYGTHVEIIGFSGPRNKPFSELLALEHIVEGDVSGKPKKIIDIEPGTIIEKGDIGFGLDEGSTINIGKNSIVDGNVGENLNGGIINIEEGVKIIGTVGENVMSGTINIKDGVKIEDEVGKSMAGGTINIKSGASVGRVGYELNGGTINIYSNSQINGRIGTKMRSGKIYVEKDVKISFFHFFNNFFPSHAIGIGISGGKIYVEKGFDESKIDAKASRLELVEIITNCDLSKEKCDITDECMWSYDVLGDNDCCKRKGESRDCENGNQGIITGNVVSVTGDVSGKPKKIIDIEPGTIIEKGDIGFGLDEGSTINIGKNSIVDGNVGEDLDGGIINIGEGVTINGNVGESMIDGTINIKSSKIKSLIGEYMAGGVINIESNVVTENEVGKDMTGGKIYIENGFKGKINNEAKDKKLILELVYMYHDVFPATPGGSTLPEKITLNYLKENYNKAMKDYRTIIDSFASEKEKDIDSQKTFGEQALLEAIRLAESAKQNKNLSLLCKEFEEKYPKSIKDISDSCNEVKLVNSEIAIRDVLIDSRVKSISFEGIYEPTPEEYSADIRIKMPDGKQKPLRLMKNQIYYLGESNPEKRIFSIKHTTKTTKIYFRYEGGWEWSLTQRSWVKVPKIQFGGGGIAATAATPFVNENKDLIESLDGMNFNEGKSIILGESEAKQEGAITNNLIQLISLDENSARVKINIEAKSLAEVAKKPFVSITKNIKKNVPESFGGGYIFELTDINLKKQAKVSVIPNIKNAETEANFSFKVGIEKRAIQLSPEQIKSRLESINDTIKKWESISKNLGKVVKGFQASCLGVGAWLTIKNFWANTEGKAGARHEVTQIYRDTKCNSQNRLKDETLSKCLFRLNDKIETDVEDYANIRFEKAKINTGADFDKLDAYREGKKINGDEITEEQINTELEKLKNNFPKGELEYGGKIINLDDFKKNVLTKEGVKEGLFSQRDIIEIIHNSKLRDSGSDVLKEIGNKEMYSDVSNILSKYNQASAGREFAANYNQEVGAVTIGVGKKTRIFPVNELKTYGSLGYNFNDGLKIDEGQHVQLFRDVPTGGKDYLLLLTSDGVIDKTYLIGDDKKTLTKVDNLNVKFNVFDAESYENKIENSKVIFWERSDIQGVPSIVPFDTKNGWYAATEAPASDKIRSVDTSRALNFFYLCNVMANRMIDGIAEGDDKCIGIDKGNKYANTGGFVGMSKGEVMKKIDKGEEALMDASRVYKKGLRGKIKIGNEYLEVGDPVVNLPGTQCEDFMSPEDCNILFNVCDPVVCPSSRCNLGGTWPVSNVIQTGIFGSIALCLPNFGNPLDGGVAVPVCLTGVKSGVDGLVSVFHNYKDCLQTNLDTGETVGICDEIHSIYLCEFFWRQGIPLAKMGIPRLLEKMYGQGNKGGGEYAGVPNAWANAEKTVKYMAQYYGSSSYEAFKVRATEEIEASVCGNSISARYPTDVDFFDALMGPDSPSQHHAYFSEIPYTTATVPPISQYKVFYHIYAGKDIGAYFQVYLKSPAGTSFYQDNQRLNVASGYIAKSDYASETKDFTAPSGYKELCISVNGKDECGFKQVSTSFAVDYIKDEYMKEQGEQTDINSEKECISGSSSLYSLITPNIQEGVDEAINPDIRERGIVRVCSTDSPGKATDNSRWQQVGNCGEEKMKCWLDTDSLRGVIQSTAIEGEALKKVKDNTLERLRSEGKYLEKNDFDNIMKLNPEKDANNIIDIITKKLIGKAFLSKEKAQLYFLRGNAFRELTIKAYDELKTKIREREQEKEEEIEEKEEEGEDEEFKKYKKYKIDKVVFEQERDSSITTNEDEEDVNIDGDYKAIINLEVTHSCDKIEVEIKSKESLFGVDNLWPDKVVNMEEFEYSGEEFTISEKKYNIFDAKNSKGNIIFESGKSYYGEVKCYKTNADKPRDIEGIKEIKIEPTKLTAAPREYCSDSDNGKDYFKEGFVSGFSNSNGKYTFLDECNDNLLTEHYCEGRTFKKENNLCDYGCNDYTGACLKMGKKQSENGIIKAVFLDKYEQETNDNIIVDSNEEFKLKVTHNCAGFKYTFDDLDDGVYKTREEYVWEELDKLSNEINTHEIKTSLDRDGNYIFNGVCFISTDEGYEDMKESRFSSNMIVVGGDKERELYIDEPYFFLYGDEENEIKEVSINENVYIGVKNNCDSVNYYVLKFQGNNKISINGQGELFDYEDDKISEKEISFSESGAYAVWTYCIKNGNPILDTKTAGIVVRDESTKRVSGDAKNYKISGIGFYILEDNERDFKKVTEANINDDIYFMVTHSCDGLDYEFTGGESPINLENSNQKLVERKVDNGVFIQTERFMFGNRLKVGEYSLETTCEAPSYISGESMEETIKITDDSLLDEELREEQETKIEKDTLRCNSMKDCQIETGKRIIEIVNEERNKIEGMLDIKGVKDVDESLKKEGVAENFECLILQVAMQESSLLHCGELSNGEITQYNKENNGLYCNSNDNMVLEGYDGKSYGVMQINIGAHKIEKSDINSFEENVGFSIYDVLIPGYYTYNKEYSCLEYNKLEQYSGWKQSLRRYNGWGCNKDTFNYVEEVTGEVKEEIKKLFPEC